MNGGKLNNSRSRIKHIETTTTMAANAPKRHKLHNAKVNLGLTIHDGTNTHLQWKQCRQKHEHRTRLGDPRNAANV
jgi:hypothetical protein